MITEVLQNVKALLGLIKVVLKGDVLSEAEVTRL